MVGLLQLHAVTPDGIVHAYDLGDWDYLQTQANNLLNEIWMVEMGAVGVKGLEKNRVLLWSQKS